MHSSGMRTARSLTVFQHALPGGCLPTGVSARGGVCPGGCLPGGVSAQGVGLPREGVCPGCLPGGVSVFNITYMLFCA